VVSRRNIINLRFKIPCRYAKSGKITDRFGIFQSGKQKDRETLWIENGLWLEVTSCYKNPEYRLPNTGFFIINITPFKVWGTDSQCPVYHLTVKILNPSDSFHIRDFAKIALGD
jgi:hypothetical protein